MGLLASRKEACQAQEIVLVTSHEGSGMLHTVGATGHAVGLDVSALVPIAEGIVLVEDVCSFPDGTTRASFHLTIREAHRLVERCAANADINVTRHHSPVGM